MLSDNTKLIETRSTIFAKNNIMCIFRTYYSISVQTQANAQTQYYCI